jgi:hypothetical protein
MEQSQTSNDKPKKNCGCGNANTTITHKERPPLTDQQQKLINRIKKTNQSKNSIFKTSTRYFM